MKKYILKILIYYLYAINYSAINFFYIYNQDFLICILKFIYLICLEALYSSEI